MSGEATFKTATITHPYSPSTLGAELRLVDLRKHGCINREHIMITLEEVIDVHRPVDECFQYVADVRTTVEWDATAIEAKKKTPGPISLNTQFALKCKSGPTKLSLVYTVTELVP
ncbi:MAG: hypothetical protein CME57_07415, partial [Halieaceae bacterium]|nr:hypothetical protein [Halieaceae bacterium]